MVPLKNARINELPVCAAPKAGYLFVIFNKDKNETQQIEIDFFTPSTTSQNFEWVPDTEYLTGDVVTYGGLWWQAQQDMDTFPGDNVVPGTNPLFWVQISKAASGFVLWAPGVFTEDNVFVVHPFDGGMYIFYLIDPTRPFVSEDIDAEFAAGDWGVVGQLDHFRGYFLDFAALSAIVGRPGDYAFVDAGVGSDSLKYIWDDNDAQWVQAGSGGTATWGGIGGSLPAQGDLWTELQAKELFSNKATDFSVVNNILYPSVQAVKTYVDAGLATKQNTSEKNASGGYVGLTGFAINFLNTLGTFTSLLSNAATAARTYLFPDRSMTVAGTDDFIGVQDVPVPASAMLSRLTGGGSPAQAVVGANNNNYYGMYFPAGSTTYAQFGVTMPRNYNNGNITAVFKWYSTAGTAAQVVEWNIAAVAFGDNVSLDAARPAVVAVQDALQNTNRLHISAATGNFAPGGTPADGKYILFEVSRTGTGADTLAATAILLEVVLYVTTDAGKAA